MLLGKQPYQSPTTIANIRYHFKSTCSTEKVYFMFQLNAFLFLSDKNAVKLLSFVKHTLFIVSQKNSLTFVVCQTVYIKHLNRISLKFETLSTLSILQLNMNSLVSSNTYQWRIQDLTLGGGVNFVNGGCRQSLKVLKVEVKIIFQRVLAIFLLKLCLKIIASEEKFVKMQRFQHKKILGPRPLRGARRVRPPGFASAYHGYNTYV